MLPERAMKDVRDGRCAGQRDILSGSDTSVNPTLKQANRDLAARCGDIYLRTRPASRFVVRRLQHQLLHVSTENLATAVDLEPAPLRISAPSSRANPTLPPHLPTRSQPSPVDILH